MIVTNRKITEKRLRKRRGLAVVLELAETLITLRHIVQQFLLLSFLLRRHHDVNVVLPRYARYSLPRPTRLHQLNRRVVELVVDERVVLLAAASNIDHENEGLGQHHLLL